MRSNMMSLLLITSILLLQGCETLYFNTMEKVGVHKRDILIDRIEAVSNTHQTLPTNREV